MTIRNDASLRGKAKDLAKRYGLSAQEIMQRYFFEHLLLRLAKTRYRENFILKGGLLLSALIGVTERTSMDMDTTLKDMRLNENTLLVALREVCSVSIDDGMAFSVDRVEPIRDDNAYGGLRAHITVTFGRMIAPMKLDVTTGDAITPREIEYPFPMLFDEGTVNIMAYPLTTCFAEKYETIIRRGASTTRARDLYDIAILAKEHLDNLDWKILKRAVSRTAQQRDSINLMEDYMNTCREIEESAEIERIWNAYCRNNPYAASTSVKEAMDAVRLIGGRISPLS